MHWLIHLRAANAAALGDKLRQRERVFELLRKTLDVAGERHLAPGKVIENLETVKGQVKELKVSNFHCLQRTYVVLHEPVPGLARRAQATFRACYNVKPGLSGGDETPYFHEIFEHLADDLETYGDVLAIGCTSTAEKAHHSQASFPSSPCHQFHAAPSCQRRARVLPCRNM